MSEQSMDIVPFIESLRPRMINSIWRILRNDDDVEDVIQEALEKIWKRMDVVLAHPNRVALILRICINQAYDHQRRRRRWSRFTELVEHFRPGNSSLLPSEIYAQKEKHSRVMSAISRLPRREAEAILLLAMEDLSYQEIAQAMDCRESTVRVLISRARRRLEKMLKGKKDAFQSMEANLL